VKVTASCGAVRHGAECFNFMFPQDLDEEFLIVWDGFSNPPWQSAKEPELRKFLIDRAREGYSFPVNPVWPIRDVGWWDVLQAVRSHAQGDAALSAWYPKESRVLERIEELHKAHPGGFQVLPPPPDAAIKKGASRMSLIVDMTELDALEMASFVESEVVREVRKRWRRIRKAIILELKRQGAAA